MDVLLPSITLYSGKDMIPVAIFHGILIDMSVPFFVSLFCSLQSYFFINYLPAINLDNDRDVVTKDISMVKSWLCSKSILGFPPISLPIRFSSQRIVPVLSAIRSRGSLSFSSLITLKSAINGLIVPMMLHKWEYRLSGHHRRIGESYPYLPLLSSI